MARLSTVTRHNVVILHQCGLSQTKVSKQTGVSRCAVQGLMEKHKKTGVEDRRLVVSQGKLVQQMKHTSSLFPFEIRRCVVVPSAQNQQKPERPR